MCVICEPAAHAAAARVLNAARMERACPLHVRCGCLGGRGGRAPSQRRRGRCEGVRSPVHHPNSRRQTTVLSKISGAYTYRPQSTGNEAKSVLPCPRKVECMYEKVYSVVSAMTRTRVCDPRRALAFDDRGHVTCRVFWCDVCGVMCACCVRSGSWRATEVNASL